MFAILNKVDRVSTSLQGRDESETQTNATSAALPGAFLPTEGKEGKTGWEFKV